MKTHPDVVLRQFKNVTDYICQVSELFFEENACNALCIDNLWSNNVIMSEEDYWKFDGKFVYEQHIPLFKKYDQPYIIHNVQMRYTLTHRSKNSEHRLYSYAYYPSRKIRITELC